jgi:hypothetical protein
MARKESPMSWVLTLSLALLLPTQATRPMDPKNLPADWPPLPDFKHPVDYVKWWQDRANSGITDDARPLWNELSGNEDASEEAQETNHLLWGEDKHGGIPGLLTGSQFNNNRKAWDPLDFPEWEEAYQKQRARGLHEKLIAVSQRPRLSITMTWAHQSRNDDPLYSMFRAEDRLLSTGLSPSLASHRQAVKVLLQNAWRAPDGRPDAQAMGNAFTASVRLAQQVERSGTVIGLLVGRAIRELAYDNILEMLQEGGFSPDQIVRIDNWLAINDNRPLSWQPAQVAEIAGMLDLLQFAYLPEDGVWREPLRPNMRNVTKLARLIQAANKAAPQMAHPVLDMTGETVRYNPRATVAGLIKYELDVREIWRRRSPFEAAAEHERRLDEFFKEPATHVILRQFRMLSVGSLPGRITAEYDTARRATRIVFALHRHRNRTGKWPTNLGELRPILLVSIQTDPFSGKPFIYRLENGQPLLYSAGHNAKDDGGKHKPYRYQDTSTESTMNAWEVDYVYWPVQKER